VDIDLAKFFDRVNHQRLLSRLAQRVKDKGVLQLIGQMLKAKVVLPDGTRVMSEEGTPQGVLFPHCSRILFWMNWIGSWNVEDCGLFGTPMTPIFSWPVGVPENG
jgi:retron-type reverse transcriptase